MHHLDETKRSHHERHDFDKELLDFHPKLMSVCCSLTRDVAAAEDLAQEALTRALNKWETYTPGTSIGGWLCTIARNLYIAERRRDKFRGEWNPEFENIGLTLQAAITQIECIVDFRRFLLCVACLTPERRDAFMAVGYVGFTYEEAADRLKCLKNTMRSRVGRARSDVHTLFKSEARIPEVDLSHLCHACRGMSEDHPAYPIAKAYEELYRPIAGHV